MQDNNINNLAKLASGISGVILIIGIIGGVPYSFYQILRWVICGSSILNVIKYSNKNQAALIFFVILAILFNPIAPIYMSRSTWQIFDALALVVFIGSLAK